MFLRTFHKYGQDGEFFLSWKQSVSYQNWSSPNSCLKEGRIILSIVLFGKCPAEWHVIQAIHGGHFHLKSSKKFPAKVLYMG